jgi:NTE family protein
MTNFTGPWPADGSETLLIGPPPTPSGRALALSGGGLRATLFHLGVVERLHQLGALTEIEYITSVSGGSILAGQLARVWSRLVPNGDFQALVADPILKVARYDLRDRALHQALLHCSPSRQLARLLDKALYDGATLGGLPEKPRFSFNSCNLANGKRYLFTRGYYGERDAYSVAGWRQIPLASAVTASAAFPVGFAPFTIDVAGTGHTWGASGLVDSGIPVGTVELADGGIFENLGLQAARHRAQEIFVSNAGAVVERDAPPAGGLVDTLVRAITIIMSRNSHNLVDGLPYQNADIVIVNSIDRAAGGYTEREAAALATLRTDLDVFSDAECDALRWHGQSLVTGALARQKTAWANPTEAPALGPKPPVSLAALAAGKHNSVTEVFTSFWRW